MNKMNDNRPIGVFDSGVGGLSVLKKLVKKLPDENYIYFGDTARVPYGEKSREQLLDFSREILNWYKSLNVKAVLMACNTSSAVTLNELKDNYDFPILGLIQPTADYISSLDINKVGIIATSATVKSGAYSKSIKNCSKGIEVFETPCPGLVEIVESGKINDLESKQIVEKYINTLTSQNVEKIVLGCTHYPFLSDVINDILERDDMLIDPACCLVEQAFEVLNNLGLINSEGQGSRKYYVSGDVDSFINVARIFYEDCQSAEQINFSLLSI